MIVEWEGNPLWQVVGQTCNYELGGTGSASQGRGTYGRWESGYGYLQNSQWLIIYSFSAIGGVQNEKRTTLLFRCAPAAFEK